MGIKYQKTRCLLGWSWCSNCSSGCYIWLDMDHVVEHEKSLICSNPLTMSPHVPTFCMKWSSFTCNFDFQDWSGCFIGVTFPTYTIVHRKKSVNPKKHPKKTFFLHKSRYTIYTHIHPTHQQISHGFLFAGPHGRILPQSIMYLLSLWTLKFLRMRTNNLMAPSGWGKNGAVMGDLLTYLWVIKHG